MSKKKTKPELYLCKVRGFRNCNYAVLKKDEYGWWQYYKSGFWQIVEGWIRCTDLEVLEVIHQIKEEDQP